MYFTCNISGSLTGASKISTEGVLFISKFTTVSSVFKELESNAWMPLLSKTIY